MKLSAMRLFEALAAIAIGPTVISLKLEEVLLGRARACLSISERSSLWTGLTGTYKRRALLPWLIAAVGQEVSIEAGTILTKPTIEIGNFVYIGRHCILGDVSIGDKTMISDYVRVVTGQHGMAPETPMAEQAETYRRICLGQDVWVGSGATILADLGDHCVIGAGSVVTKPVPDYLIVAGNPARPIGDRRDRNAKDQ
jgi:virginiamycin A acetyltransferase